MNKQKRFTMERRKSLLGLVFLLPFIIGLLLFFLYPMADSLRYSFSAMQRPGVAKNMTFAGFDNFARALLMDVDLRPLLYESVLTTLINTPLITVFSLILAITLNKPFRGRTVFRGLYFLPFLLGAGFVLRLLLGLGIEDGDIEMYRGIVLTQDLAEMFGPVWTLKINSFLRVIVLSLWSSGLQMLLFLAGLQGIPQSLFESAKVDGANEWVFFWKITLPMLSPVILINIVYTIVASFTDSENPALKYIVKVGLGERHEYAYAAAISWLYFVIMLIIIAAVFIISGRFVIKSDRS